jgi:dTDP-4-amino-4,6-dideoxygalactose transaminase|tara:strand:- start:629 stop:1318 length:690 start_codon:yes stop_codon:yes gene_type:complete
MGYKIWPVGKIPKEFQRPELDQVREYGYDWNDPWDVVEMFENEVAKFAGCKYGISVDNCTDGLFLCLKYLNYDGEITIPSRTYVSVPMTIINAGCKVKFEDIEWSGIYQLNPTKVYDGATRWTEGMYEAGDGFQVVSFQIKKRIPIGKGGMILTNDENAVDWFKMMRYEGRHNEIKYEKDDFGLIGYNMYMTPEDAARGLILMKHTPKVNEDTGGAMSCIDLTKQKVFK